MGLGEGNALILPAREGLPLELPHAMGALEFLIELGNRRPPGHPSGDLLRIRRGGRGEPTFLLLDLHREALFLVSVIS